MGIENIIKENKKIVEVEKKGIYYEYEGDKYLTLEALNEDIDIADELNTGIDVVIDNKKYYFSFETCSLPNCCGVIEFGGFGIDKGVPEKELAKILDVIAIKQGKTTIITTNGKDSSVIMEKALAISKYFTLVKSFRNNVNSGNLVKVWLSNNE